LVTWEFPVSDQRDNQERGYLERVNAELTHSLRRCHALVDDCRNKLAANSNEPPALVLQLVDDGADEQEDESVG
jgi:hypothetical protein